MKNFKLILLLLGIIILSSCRSKENVFFLDEDFILVDKKEVITADNDGNTIKVRSWTIHRVIQDNDSVYVAEIVTTNNTSRNHFRITNELWDFREIGDILHFNNINKKRFSKRKLIDTDMGDVTKPKIITLPSTTTTNEVSLFGLEKERRILEIERNIQSLQLELNRIKIN